MSQFNFQVGSKYKRSEIKQSIGLDPNTKGGPWDTGYAERNGADFIFCNVGIPGRTGHDYNNYFDQDDLVWHGKNGSHKNQPTIVRMTSASAEVHVFWRSDERDSFTYAGLANAVDVIDKNPVQVRWRFEVKSEQATRDSRSQARLPADELDKVTPEYVWNAVQLLLDGYANHQFAASTDYDLLAEGGQRLAPKAVFGVAATLALGYEILPKHFTAGENSTCFRILRNAGFSIVKKDELLTPISPSLSNEDQEWTEGRTILVAHLVKERAKGLAQAKKSRFRREHGKLYCERCGLDPVEHYKTPFAESCIEVHHHETQLRDMNGDHLTRLESLQCLCANCHRLIHRILREHERGAIAVNA